MLQERETHAKLRERSGKIEADLTELQASSTLAAAQAAAERVSEGLNCAFEEALTSCGN